MYKVNIYSGDLVRNGLYFNKATIIKMFIFDVLISHCEYFLFKIQNPPPLPYVQPHKGLEVVHTVRLSVWIAIKMTGVKTERSFFLPG